jgi:sugar phosphate isomerase/epimerase
MGDGVLSSVRLAAFADEISQDLDEQLDTLERLSIRSIELRGVWGKNALDLDAREIDEVHATCRDRGFTIPVIGSPIGKIGIREDFEAHLERLDKALALAERFDAAVRVFSFYIPEGDDPQAHREAVLHRMEALVARAGERDVKLFHENESDIYGESPERCRDLIDSIGSPSLRVCFDAANFIVKGYRPWPDAWDILADSVEHVHIKDARSQDRSICPAGEGDADYVSILEALRQKEYSGLLTLEPHLSAAGRMSGWSGPERFAEAVHALRRVMSKAGLEELRGGTL